MNMCACVVTALRSGSRACAASRRRQLESPRHDTSLLASAQLMRLRHALTCFPYTGAVISAFAGGRDCIADSSRPGMPTAVASDSPALAILSDSFERLRRRRELRQEALREIAHHVVVDGQHPEQMHEARLRLASALLAAVQPDEEAAIRCDPDVQLPVRYERRWSRAAHSAARGAGDCGGALARAAGPSARGAAAARRRKVAGLAPSARALSAGAGVGHPTDAALDPAASAAAVPRAAVTAPAWFASRRAGCE
jgi:hypothetical protein